MTMQWFYDIRVILYAACVCGFFIDFLQNNRKAHQLAFWLLSIVWVLQLSTVVVKVSHTQELLIVTPSDGVFFVAWVIVSASLFYIPFLWIFCQSCWFCYHGDNAVSAR